MNTAKKLFAFKLVEKHAGYPDRAGGKWKARDGVSADACTGPIAAVRHLAVAVNIDSSIVC